LPSATVADGKVPKFDGHIHNRRFYNGYRLKSMLWLRRTRSLLGILALLVVASCTTVARVEWDRTYGRAAPVERGVPGPVAAYREPEYYRDIKPIFDRRCVVCHGCYDAPCQLKLDSFSGVDRGATERKVYDGSRLLAENLTRLFIDAQSTGQWRGKGFYPVLNEFTQDTATNLAGSSLYQMLLLKRDHPLPTMGTLPDTFDFSLDRAQSCTRVESFAGYARANPQAGMPYGMPAIEDAHFQTIRRWLETGAKVATPPPLAAALQDEVRHWEEFLNGASLQEQLMARYIYEHLYLGDLYFGTTAPGAARNIGTVSQFFKLVRSRTPPGQPTDLIASRRPFDDPGVARVYYRLEPLRATTLVKTHMPYPLDNARQEKWRAWFLGGDYHVAALPSYEPDIASNPFKAFRDIPTGARYRFLLDEAQFTIMGFIKGPVCRGQIALNVIEDQFWVFFVDPDAMDASREGEFLAQQSDNLRLPAEAESNAVPLNWRRYSQAQLRFLEAKTAFLDNILEEGPGGPALDDIWNGYGVNPNAALTVFRHFDSATVVQGMVGETPKTAWVVGYALLERIHYLLVAGYDVYGNVGHQLMTRMYMDFLRMEGEFNFLAFLPQADRMRERRLWYRNVNEDVADFVYGPDVRLDRETTIPFLSSDPKSELLAAIRDYLGPALSRRWELDLPAGTAPVTQAALRELQHLRGAQLRFMPELALMSIAINGQRKPFTLIHNNGHSNVATLLFEQDRLLPAEDTLSFVPGILGAYPGVFFDLDEAQLPLFVAAVERLQSEADFTQLMDRFAVRRNAPQFWARSDWWHEQLQRQSPVEAGILDYNRFENR
jgi:hypothetical protein